jgi:3'-phosphoadenosine 5'-phosphosulfate sulfotransferase (PAPS reductase)/FAD synthetase
MIEGPATVSFSGGRTSGYMLRRCLDAGLQPDVHVLFANTGKERPETLDFVQACAERWDVTIHWIEYAFPEPFAERNYTTASRAGEPFTALIHKRQYPPNPVTRFCTSELKIRPMRNWMRAQGYDDALWTNVVGIRADEPRRVARMRGKNTEGRWDCALPLADAGVTVGDVMAFWAAQPFDLQLRQSEGNCDLCFLKGTAKRRNIIRERPDLAVWWAEQEAWLGKTFRRDTPSYAALLNERDLFAHGEEDLIECYCTD